jgi:hypothetical protein
LLKEIKEDLNKLKECPCLWVERFHVVKIATHPKLSTNSIQSLSKFQLASLQKLTSWSHGSYGNVRDSEWPKQC